MPQELAQVFLSAREGVAPPEPLPALEARFARALEGARFAWPTVVLDGSLFTAHLARHLPLDSSLEALEQLHLSIDQLGALYGVHRATAARWVLAAQEALLEETRRLLAERLRLTHTQLDSVLRLISSQIDVNLSRLLRSRID